MQSQRRDMQICIFGVLCTNYASVLSSRTGAPLTLTFRSQINKNISMQPSRRLSYSVRKMHSCSTFKSKEEEKHIKNTLKAAEGTSKDDGTMER